MLIFQLIQRHIRRRFLQSTLFVLGVALGVAIGLAIDLANTSASRAFNLSAQSISGRTTHQVIGGPTGLTSDLYRQIRVDLGLTYSAPIVESYVRGVNLGDQPLRLLGVEVLAEAPFRNYLGDASQNQAEVEAFNAFIVSPDAILISASLAERFGFELGDTLILRINARQVEGRIVGLLQPNDTLSQQALDDLVLTDIATAQEWLGMEGRLTRIDLILPAEYDVAALQAALPQGAVLTTPAQRQSALNQMTDAFEINLQALSLLGLVVGVFLIYNTVMFSVVQRRHVIGIMRSLGTTRLQIFRLVLGEALLLGLLGTALGLLLGVVMAQGTVGAISQTVSDLYFRVNVQTVTLSEASLLRGAVIGILASLAAAFIPSIDATLTTPVGSMRRSDLEQGVLKLIPYVTGLGLVMVIAGVGVLQIPTQSLIISFGGLFLVVIGAALFTPLGMVVLARLSTPLMGALFGILGRMAPRAVVRSLSRTAVAVAALTLSVSVMVGVGVMISSFRATVVDWLDVILGADIFISTPAASTDSNPNIDPALIERLAAVEGVAYVPVARNVDVFAPAYPDLPPVNIVAIDRDLSDGRRRFAWTNVPADEDYRDWLRAGQVMVSESFAFHRDITPENNRLTLMTDKGAQTFEIFGVFYDYTSDQGSVFIDLRVYRDFFDDPYVTSLGIIAEEGADVGAIIDTLRTETLVGEDLEVQSNRELRDAAIEVFDRTFSITVALQILATLVAFIGILSALLALQLEHLREYGIMRANGMTTAQLRRFTLLQTGLIGAISGVMALPIGVTLALILIYVINVRSFGWTMDLQFPPAEFAQALAVAFFAALLAGVYPAWRVSRVQAAEAIRGE
jgi:putative ABC transport system permease protein